MAHLKIRLEGILPRCVYLPLLDRKIKPTCCWLHEDMCSFGGNCGRTHYTHVTYDVSEMALTPSMTTVIHVLCRRGTMCDDNNCAKAHAYLDVDGSFKIKYQDGTTTVTKVIRDFHRM